MKFAKIVFLMAAIATLGLASCKKDEAKPDISGDWEGTWGFGSDAPSYYEKWTLESNGDLGSYFSDGTLYGTGSWELNGNDFEARYQPLGDTYTYVFTGTLNGEKINGDWNELQDPANGGTFKMYKE
jgi:opacity protein-like surface antigen